MPKLRKCPFCGADVSKEPCFLMYNDLIEKWVLHHHCSFDKDDQVGVIFAAPSKEKLVNIWNGIKEENTNA